MNFVKLNKFGCKYNKIRKYRDIGGNRSVDSKWLSVHTKTI